MATAPAFAATPRIGCGHITAGSPDLGTVTASTPATGTVQVTFAAPSTGTIAIGTSFSVHDLLGVPTGVFLTVTADTAFTGSATVQVPVQAMTAGAGPNGWSASDHLLGQPVPNTYTATGAALVGSLTGGVTGSDLRHRDPSAAVTVLIGGANGTKVAEVSVQSTGAVPDGSTVVLWLHDGSTAHAWCELHLPAETDGSRPRVGSAVGNLLLPGPGWSLRATATSAADAGELVVTALGGDL